ncbi:MAG: LysM peptidoglycan-binding domain-containing protein [Chloroflexi bacterium]|nr:LysM peptidoglycan-binding domain-containing protein [Chloroflexota bacterium]
MFQHKPQRSRLGLIARMTLMALLVVSFILIVIATAIALLTGDNLALSRAVIFESPSPRSGSTPTIAPLLAVTPGPAGMTSLRNVALGFTIEYPAGWRKKETSLRVTFAPTTAGLEPEPLTESVIWVGISADNSFEPANVLANILTDFPTNTKSSYQSTITVAGVSWSLTDLSFGDETAGKPGRARAAVASRNEVGYFVVVVAPVEQWPAAEPVFQAMLNSFRFTAEAVIRPTDATPPPTPTPSPTPRIYIVQPGDTLGGIALQFGVSIEALVTRNGLEDPRLIRTGQKLIIPNKRK